MLQNLANKPSYSKEAYMANLNPFVEANKAKINAFLNSLCEVGDFYDTLEVRRTRLDSESAELTPPRCRWTSTLPCRRRISRSTSL